MKRRVLLHQITILVVLLLVSVYVLAYIRGKASLYCSMHKDTVNPRTTVLIRAGFLDHPHRSQVFEQPSWEPVSRFKQHDLDGEKPT